MLMATERNCTNHSRPLHVPHMASAIGVKFCGMSPRMFLFSAEEDYALQGLG